MLKYIRMYVCIYFLSNATVLLLFLYSLFQSSFLRNYQCHACTASKCKLRNIVVRLLNCDDMTSLGSLAVYCMSEILVL